MRQAPLFTGFGLSQSVRASGTSTPNTNSELCQSAGSGFLEVGDRRSTTSVEGVIEALDDRESGTVMILGRRRKWNRPP
jgi:hypothetical protein